MSDHGLSLLQREVLEILANKLGCLLHRAELRDLIDIRALLATGLDLGNALTVAGRKDGGFSPLMVAHLLDGFPIDRQATQLGLGEPQRSELDTFRRELALRIAAAARVWRCCSILLR
jgi:hypothetical protein